MGLANLPTGTTEIEVILENNIEKDSLQGIYEGYEEFLGTNYLKIRMQEFGNITYIAQRVIKVIHIYKSEGPKGRGGP